MEKPIKEVASETDLSTVEAEEKNEAWVSEANADAWRASGAEKTAPEAQIRINSCVKFVGPKGAFW